MRFSSRTPIPQNRTQPTRMMSGPQRSCAGILQTDDLVFPYYPYYWHGIHEATDYWYCGGLVRCPAMMGGISTSGSRRSTDSTVKLSRRAHIQRIVTDNGSCYRAKDLAHVLHGARHQFITGYTPPQRKGRAIPPHPGRRVPLCPHLDLRDPTSPSAQGLEHPLQLPSTAFCRRRPATSITRPSFLEVIAVFATQ